MISFAAPISLSKGCRICWESRFNGALRKCSAMAGPCSAMVPVFGCPATAIAARMSQLTIDGAGKPQVNEFYGLLIARRDDPGGIMLGLPGSPLLPLA